MSVSMADFPLTYNGELRKYITHVPLGRSPPKFYGDPQGQSVSCAQTGSGSVSKQKFGKEVKLPNLPCTAVHG